MNTLLHRPNSLESVSALGIGRRATWGHMARYSTGSCLSADTLPQAYSCRDTRANRFVSTLGTRRTRAELDARSPLESAVDRQGGAGRFPLAAAWSGRRISDAEWEWDSVPEEPLFIVEPIDAVAVACRSVVARYGRPKTAVVIPNDFHQSEQQRELDEINQVHPDTQLLWLPVAAALAWLEGSARRSGPSLPRRAWRSSCRALRLGQLQCSRLELRSVERHTAVPVVPARRRPVVADKAVCGFGWTLVESGGDLVPHWGESRLGTEPPSGIVVRRGPRRTPIQPPSGVAPETQRLVATQQPTAKAWKNSSTI